MTENRVMRKTNRLGIPMCYFPREKIGDKTEITHNDKVERNKDINSQGFKDIDDALDELELESSLQGCATAGGVII